MAVTPAATGRGAQVVTNPVSNARQAIRGAYAWTLEGAASADAVRGAP